MGPTARTRRQQMSLTVNTSSKSRLYPIWLLALILPVGGRYRHVLTAVTIMALLWLVLDALGGKTDHYEKLFFSAVIAYSIAIFSRIIARILSGAAHIPLPICP